MRKHRRVLILAAGLACAMSIGFPEARAQKTVTIGTAAVMGVYYPLGGAICRMVNATRKEHRIRCSVEPSEGSVANIKGVIAGDLDLGIAQSDTQYYALKGEGPFKDNPQPALRALFTVYPEVFTLMARADANIRKLEDIRGKRIAIGTAGSGTRSTLELVLKSYGITMADLKSAVGLRFIELAPALCDNKIDAFVFVGGHPNAILSDASTSCATTVASVAGAPIDKLVASQPFYAKAEVPAKMYKGTDAAQPSFGTVATVVVSADMSDGTAYAITRAVFENFADFKKLHPAIANITKEGALRGETVPFHPGAVKYFKEVGLM
jgi:uncharacterized protein